MVLLTRSQPVSLVRFLKAAAGSGAPNTDVPHTSTSAPADRRSATLLSSTPPSTCTLTLGSRTRRKRRIRSTESGISSCPEYPGWMPHAQAEGDAGLHRPRGEVLGLCLGVDRDSGLQPDRAGARDDLGQTGRRTPRGGR